MSSIIAGHRYATCEKAIEDAIGETLVETPDSDRPLKSIVQAIDWSGYSIHKLHMEYLYFAAFLREPGDVRLLVFAERLFACLKSLELHTIYDEGVMSITQMSRMSWMFGAARNLESIELSTWCGAEDSEQQSSPWHIMRFIATFTLPAVSWIKLNGFVFDLDAIIKFIGQNKTFKTVTIRNSPFLVGELDMYVIPTTISEHDEALSTMFKERAGLETIDVENCKLQIREAIEQ